MHVGQRLGPYEILALEGAGGMGEVYRARDTRLNREVAIKVLPDRVAARPESLARLAREAQILASLNHPNIAAIYGVEEQDDLQALVLELVEGPTLADRIAQGRLPLAAALATARQIATALDAAHENGIIHRDLKPSNIKLRPDGTVKILDFGLAKALEQPLEGDVHAATVTTTPGAVLGTFAYMSPEQLRGSQVDKRTDIWAFGCVLFEMLSGKKAFDRDTSSDAIAAVLDSEPDWTALPDSIPLRERTLMTRCLQKDRQHRLRDIGDAKLALEGRFDLKPGGGNEQQAAASDTSAPSKRVLAWAAIAAIAGSAVGWSVARSRSPEVAATSYVIHSPHATQFNNVTMEPYPSMSPDGRHLAYIADGAVWVHRLGDLSARKLPGTERVGQPFWSPDGQFIGIWGAGGLRTIAAGGGNAPDVVCACTATAGATWGPDETLLFSHTSGLSRVAAGGGPVTAVTTVAKQRGEFAHMFPRFLPDGRRFLYLVRSFEDEHRGIYISSLDNPAQARRLLQDDSNVDYGTGPDGRAYLFFVRDVTLLAQPFDLERGLLSGSPSIIATRVIPGEAGRFAPFAAGGRSLVFRQTSPPRSRLRWFDRRGIAEQGSFNLEGSFRYLALSADGKRLAVAEHDPDTTKLDVWIHDVGRGTRDRITTDRVGAFFPVWDHDRLIYASAREGPWHLFWRATTRPDSGRVYAAVLPFTKYPSDVTPDSRHLVFHGDSAVWLLRLAEGSEPVKLVAGLQGRVSPDGRWLAYTSGESGRREVYVTAFPQPAARVRVSTDGGEDPHWRSDGRELYFLDADQTLTGASVTLSPRFVVTAQQRLFRTAIDSRSLSFGPSYAPDRDGQRFLVNERVRDEEITLTAMENWMPAGR